MKVSIEPNPVRPDSYRVVLQPGQRLSFEAFLEHAEGSSTVTRADVLAVLTLAAGWLEGQAGRGREVDLGPLGRSRLGMKGVFEAPPDRLEDGDVQLTVGWILPRALKARVAKAGNALLRERTPGRPKMPHPVEARAILANAEPADTPNRYVPGGALRVTGRRLDYGPNQPDEGAYLIAPDGAERRIETVISVMPSELLFMMPADAAGVYTFEVRRRHPKTTGRLLTGRLDAPLTPL